MDAGGKLTLLNWEITDLMQGHRYLMPQYVDELFHLLMKIQKFFNYKKRNYL